MTRCEFYGQDQADADQLQNLFDQFNNGILDGTSKECDQTSPPCTVDCIDIDIVSCNGSETTIVACSC